LDGEVGAELPESTTESKLLGEGGLGAQARGLTVGAKDVIFTPLL